MGLADGFVNIAQGQIGKVTRKLLGGVDTSTRGKGSANKFPEGSSPSAAEGQSEILLYPEDIGTNPRVANYVLFTVFNVTPGKFLKARKVPANTGPPNRRTGIKQKTLQARAKDVENTTSLFMSSQSITKSGETIGLYMPPSVTASYNMDYKDSQIGGVTEALGGFLKTILSGGDPAAAAKTGGKTASPGLIHAGVGIIDRVLPGTQDLVALERGNIIVPRIEVMFQGIARREFSFTFTFMPKSMKESNNLFMIIKTFKKAMTPEFLHKNTTREMTFPSMFEIAYMHMNTENSYLHKIGKCFLQSADVVYGGDRFQTFNEPFPGGGAPPSKISLTLKFKEIEIMDKSKLEDGF